MKVIAEPSELLTITEVADHLRLGAGPYPDEALLLSLITTARQWCEQYLRRAIGDQTLEDTFPSFDKIVLRPPVSAIISIKYITGGVLTTLDAGKYDLMDDPDVGGVRPSYGNTWPAHDAVDDAVVVRYQTGYLTMPFTIKAAMLLIIGDLYENREAGGDKQYFGNPAVERLLSMYRLEMGV